MSKQRLQVSELRANLLTLCTFALVNNKSILPQSLMESQTGPSKCSSPLLINSKSFSSELAKKGGSPHNLQQRQSFSLGFFKNSNKPIKN